MSNHLRHRMYMYMHIVLYYSNHTQYTRLVG